MKRRWEIWTLVHGKRFRLEKLTWTKRGAEIWTARYPPMIFSINNESIPMYTWEISRRD